MKLVLSATPAAHQVPSAPWDLLHLCVIESCSELACHVHRIPYEGTIHGIALVRPIQLHVDHVICRLGHLQHFVGWIAHPSPLVDCGQT